MRPVAALRPALPHSRTGVRSLGMLGRALPRIAGIGTLLMDYRKRANADWTRFAAVTSNVPFVAIAQGRNRIVWREIGWTRPLIGLAAFAAVFLAHGWLFGARPY